MEETIPRVEVTSLDTWADIPEHEQDDPLQHSTIDFEPKFEISEEINKKIILWHGNIFSLTVDAIVHSTNESLTDRSGNGGLLFKLAGPQLATEVTTLEGCRTGESKVTKAFNLPNTSHVIHTVGPRYNQKYKTAAENALHNCYRSVLQALVENDLRSVAYCVINSPKRGYPKVEGAHVGLRTIRRFMEKWGGDISTIVLAVDNLEDYETYRNILPFYFPRNNRDLISVKDVYPDDIDELNDMGAKIIKEREIRIGTFPAGDGPLEANPLNEPTDRAILSTRPKVDTAAGLKDFMKPQTETPDDRVRKQNARKTPKQLELEGLDRQYTKLLEQAKSEDLSDIARLNCLFRSGQDTIGRPVIVAVGANFPEKQNKPMVQKFLKYIIRTLDALSGQEFILVYFHTKITQKQEPEFAWLQLLYKICDRKFPNMKNLFIVHPSLWVKVTLRLLTPFMKNPFTQKLVLVTSLGELFARVEQEAFELKIPSFVYKYDRQENGSQYNATEDSPANEGL